MSKFIFVCEKEAIPFDDCISSKKTVEFSTYNLYDVISEFQNFLRGCGYCFEGQLEIVDDDEAIEYQKMKSELDNIQSSNFDFTDIPKNNWPFNKQQDDANAKITFASEK